MDNAIIREHVMRQFIYKSTHDWTVQLLENMQLDHAIIRETPILMDFVQETTVGLIEASGYRAETHRVTTQDGYILGLHRYRIVIT